MGKLIISVHIFNGYLRLEPMDKPLSILRSLTGLIPKGSLHPLPCWSCVPTEKQQKHLDKNNLCNHCTTCKNRMLLLDTWKKNDLPSCYIAASISGSRGIQKDQKDMQETYPLSRTIPFEKLPDGRFIATRMAKKLHSCSFNLVIMEIMEIHIYPDMVYIYSVKHYTWY